MVPELLRALTLLASSAAALALFVIELRVKSTTSFVASNDFGGHARNLVIGQILGVVAAVFVVGFWYGIRRRGRWLPRVRWVARLAAPLLMLPLLPIFAVDGFGDLPIVLVTFAIFVLVAERLLRLGVAAWMDRGSVAPLEPGRVLSRLRRAGARLPTLPPGVKRHLPLLAVLAGIAFYALYMGTYTLYNHRKFGTAGYDLGQYDNMIFSTLHGQPMRCAALGLEAPWSNMRAHADLGIFLLLPVYALRPGAETILRIQAVVLALGALPLFLFARRRLTPGLAVVVAYAYLCYPPLHGANFYDFHFQPIAGVVVMAAIYFLDTRRWWLYGLFFAMALSCREDVSIGLAILGLFSLLSGYRPVAGAVSAAVALIYFVVMRFAIMPHFGTWWFSDIYRDLYPVGDASFAGVVRTLVSNPAYALKTLLQPEKLRYFLQVLTPLAFLPVRRAFLIPSMFAGGASTLLTTNYGPTLDTGFQYVGNFTGYVFPAIVVALQFMTYERDGLVRRRAAGLALALATVIATMTWGAFSPKTTLHGGFGTVAKTPPSPEDILKEKDLQALAARFPRDARVAVSEPELPHLSARMNIFPLRDGLFNVDYILYDVRTFGGARGEDALRAGTYQLVETRGFLKLLRRAPTPPPAPAPGVPPPVPFGPPGPS